MGILGIILGEPLSRLPQTKRTNGTEVRATGTIVPVLHLKKRPREVRGKVIKEGPGGERPARPTLNPATSMSFNNVDIACMHTL